MPPSLLRKHLAERAELWKQDASLLRRRGEEKGCEKCLVAAEVYEECATQLEDVLNRLPAD